MTTRKIGRDYEIYDELWKKIEPLIPPPKPKKKAGRPRKDDRKMMTAIFYILRTGCQWKTLPRSLGAPSTVHDRFQEWREAGLFEAMWKAGLMEYDMKKGIEWECIGHRLRPKFIPKSLSVDMRIKCPVSYTHLRAHETRHDLVCRLLL